MKAELTFVFVGFIGGLITALLGASRPIVLAAGVGPMFFISLLVAIAITDGWSQISAGVWRYIAAGGLSAVAYILALFVFSVIAGYAPDFLGFMRSRDILEFRADVWIGMIAAVAVAAICVEALAYILTNRWGNLVLALFAASGLLAVLLTFLGSQVARSSGASSTLLYWSFFGILLPVGEALFSGLIALQLWKRYEG